jgi:hypothetical protein
VIEMNERSHRRSVFGPLLLIGIGALFLLNNLGMLTWSVWDVIFRLWPVLLIAAGLDLVVGRSTVWGSLIAVVVLVGVVVLGVSYVQGSSAAGAGTRESLSYPIRDARRAEVQLSPAVGVLHLAGSPSTTELLSGSAWIGGGMRVAKDYSAQGESATLDLRAEGAGVLFPTLGPPGQPTWDLMLGSALPVDLSIDLGAGQSVIDLRGTQVYSLRLNQGIGQVVVYLPKNGVVRASVSTAIGETVIVIPPAVAARVHASTAIAARDIPEGFVRDGDTYTSPGYAQASDKVDLELGLPIGNLVVRVGTQ